MNYVKDLPIGFIIYSGIFFKEINCDGSFHVRKNRRDDNLDDFHYWPLLYILPISVRESSNEASIQWRKIRFNWCNNRFKTLNVVIFIEKFSKEYSGYIGRW